MTAAAPAICSKRWPRVRSFWPIAPTTAMPYGRASPSAVPGPTLKPMPNRKNVPVFSSFLYRYRNLVERFFNKLKHFRAVATRYDKRADNYLAGVKLASARIWMRFNESVA